MTYDKNNIFAKILRDEIPCNKIYEDQFVLAFFDPQYSAKISVQRKVEANKIVPRAIGSKKNVNFTNF